ncbi:hypothetical protein KIL84_000672 [Mauremys mutica]|uniref:Uncharacterized protein n=1 Tax=Mauremys mutica TaxID=74926 RepID=A0A9D3WX05_9SAUR|nr:hypothetical protein KIL84_000672 [Mauremys mutica]
MGITACASFSAYALIDRTTNKLKYLAEPRPNQRQAWPMGTANLLRFLFRYNPTAFLTAKQAAPDSNENSSCCTDEQERQDVQAVILVPGELMSCWSQVLRSFMAHDKFDPEDSSVQRLYGLVVVNLG